LEDNHIGGNAAGVFEEIRIKTRIERGKTMSKGLVLPLEGYEVSNVERKNVNLRLEGKRVRGECFKGGE
jgi:hypothetical protein